MKRLIVSALLLSVLILSACSATYICYTGTEVKNKNDCPINPYVKVAEKDAENAVESYGQAYARAKGDSYTRVNLYAKEGDWYSDAVFTNQRSASASEVLFKIDGTTAAVMCVEGCDYLEGNSTASP